MLIDKGADVNFQERQDRRTALMYACIEDDRTEEGLIIAKVESCSLGAQDRLGNTALMYAAMKGRDELMSCLVDKLSKGWGLAAIQLKNCMGYTAEDLAIRNKNHRCARMVQKQHLHMLACLNRQMGMTGEVSCRPWSVFTTIYKCIEKWKPSQRRKSEESLLVLKAQTKPMSRKNSL
ncbi:unnamed protein product [Thelazia callipaeda]|uniref:ANK_REP_REGION domain-containing protein n=1 Tax=Thelazia callipaeda TaxID=103827 RepID=A0A0N5CPF8_THECL|nr:unnamed protein product [Thelazia callipaeda]